MNLDDHINPPSVIDTLGPVAVDRHDVDDPDAWRDVVDILAGLLTDPAPEQHR